MDEANLYLETEFLPEWNHRFVVKAGSEVDAHRPVGEGLCPESILSHVETRRVMNDYAIAWEGKHWQIAREQIRPGLRGSTIRIEERLDGRLMARIGEEFFPLSVCDKAEKTLATGRMRTARRYVRSPGTSRWMDGFSVRNGKANPGKSPQSGIAAGRGDQGPSLRQQGV